MTKYEEITFTDDFIFCKILEKDKELCKTLLEVILNISIRDVVVTKQKDIKNNPDSHGIRLDIYVEDENNTIYDIEMQTGIKKDLPLRARYYQSTIDQSILAEGKIYTELKQTFIIFICTFDPFKRGKPIYTFKTMCQEIMDFEIEDRKTIIIINAQGNLKELTRAQANLWKYIMDPGCVEDKFVENIDSAVKKARINSEWRRSWMTWQMALLEKEMEAKEAGFTAGLAEGREVGLAEGREVGLAEGREVGLAQGKLEGKLEGILEGKLVIIRELLKNGMSCEEVSRLANIDLDLVKSVAE